MDFQELLEYEKFREEYKRSNPHASSEAIAKSYSDSKKGKQANNACLLGRYMLGLLFVFRFIHL